jgi:hypothetical protein
MRTIPFILLLPALLLLGCSRDGEPPADAAGDGAAMLPLPAPTLPSGDPDTDPAETPADRPGDAPLDRGVEPGPAAGDADALLPLQWQDLTPGGWRPELPFADEGIDDLDDDDPRAIALLARLKARWAEAPVVAQLDGRRIRLSGLGLPLRTEGAGMTELLLVPYFGACIHVPQPPANQVVHVVTAAGRPYSGERFDLVQVDGRLRVAPFRHALGDAGYRIEEAQVSLYKGQ